MPAAMHSTGLGLLGKCDFSHPPRCEVGVGGMRGARRTNKRTQLDLEAAKPMTLPTAS